LGVAPVSSLRLSLARKPSRKAAPANRIAACCYKCAAFCGRPLPVNCAIVCKLLKLRITTPINFWNQRCCF
jgi:hypothetical protein